MADTVLAVKGLKKELSFANVKKQALNGVDFTLARGETLGFLGESGSGKSVLMRVIARDGTQADSGIIFLNGKEVTRAWGLGLRSLKRDIQMVHQASSASFDPGKTLGVSIRENLRVGGTARGETKDRAEELFLRYGMDPSLLKCLPREVSGGECQRAAIIKAIAAEPEVLILDEATSGVDGNTRGLILSILEEAREKKNLSILFVSHELALLQQFCDRILVMKEGKVVEEGPAEKIILSPELEYTRELVRPLTME